MERKLALIAQDNNKEKLASISHENTINYLALIAQ